MPVVVEVEVVVVWKHVLIVSEFAWLAPAWHTALQRSPRHQCCDHLH